MKLAGNDQGVRAAQDAGMGARQGPVQHRQAADDEPALDRLLLVPSRRPSRRPRLAATRRACARRTALFGVAHTHPLHWSADRDEVQDFEYTIRGRLMQRPRPAPRADQAARSASSQIELDGEDWPAGPRTSMPWRSTPIPSISRCRRTSRRPASCRRRPSAARSSSSARTSAARPATAGRTTPTAACRSRSSCTTSAPARTIRPRRWGRSTTRRRCWASTGRRRICTTARRRRCATC